jgi:hypothetical protein
VKGCYRTTPDRATNLIPDGVDEVAVGDEVELL